MFEWLKSKPKRPSYSEMGARVATLIENFIQVEGLEEFSSDRLSVIINKDFSTSISAARFAQDCLVAVPLNELMLQFSPQSTDILLHMAVDVAARIVVDRLPPQSN